MFNVLLDALPEEWCGYRIDPSFRIGVQIMQVMEDHTMSMMEKAAVSADLLFLDMPQDTREAWDGLLWFLTGWNNDHHEKKKDQVRVMDYDIDQWRIYSAFRQQYRINLNDAELHFWEFMALLSNLDECAYTRVIDIRAKELDGNMSAEEKARYRKVKKIYALEMDEEEETAEDRAEVDEFLRFAGIRR